MSDVHRIAVDPYLLCLPDPCLDQTDLEGFVSRLLAWSEALRRENLEILVSEHCFHALFEDGQYPYDHRLRDLLKRFVVDFVDHNTVCVTVRSLIERTSKVEDTTGIRYVLHESEDSRVIPDTVLLRLPEKTRSAFVNMLLAISTHRRHIDDSIDVSLASSFNKNNKESHYDLHVEGTIDDIEWMDANYVSNIVLPCSLDEIFLVFDEYDAFRNQAGKWAIWDGAKSEQSVKDAIEVAIDELIDVGVNSGRRDKFVLGPNFINSLLTWGFGSRRDYAMVLIESCARIVLGKPKNTISEFWSDATAKTQLVRDDGALAYRTHLTKKGAGYRLMFWRTVDNIIEFANVGDKDELEIF